MSYHVPFGNYQGMFIKKWSYPLLEGLVCQERQLIISSGSKLFFLGGPTIFAPSVSDLFINLLTVGLNKQ